MTKTHKAMVVEIDQFVEDAILLVVEGVEVRCFANYSPSKIEVGKTYEAEFEMVLSGEDFVSATQCEKMQIKMLGSGFPCEVYGYLDGEVFRSFVDFMDQDIHYEYPHLNGQFVKINADRIDVSFVR
ncbi:hypothetical protein C1X59_26000 [Pseudomonas sp. FW215-R2]|uniref:hypothetical protein n=1 Tax=unclassified Pseudomonas TaxID=196821 RepID=UPI000C882C6B|nr:MULTISPECIES: hypothetical protein [unclassified Pseudomonas]PMW95884.1 hypothetical protein C1X59_26000 [Pseudomonas sp. FW215-R2]PMX05629.1 hypothetical protein C1X60_27105 [Pseudomonas sp. FW215-L1]PMX19286.1 hypothetical protein C1X57_25665 [Pseudomonas sp. FW215-E1]PNA24199.1 hypothetical protein C1X58_24490 [Pseudomonas sp. FW215-R4]